MIKKICILLSKRDEISSIRVMSFVCVFVGCFVGVAGLFMNKDLSDLASLCGVFVGSSIGGKAIQKFAEIKRNKIDNPDR